MADDLKLYRVEVETEVYCLADSEAEAEDVARRHYQNEESSFSARVATYVDGDWNDGLPYHAKKDLPADRTCREWFAILNGTDKRR